MTKYYLRGSDTILTERQSDETYASFLKRIVRATADKQLTYTEMGDAILGAQNVYSSENLRKAFYVLEKICENLDGDLQISSNDVIREIQKQKDELFKERVKYRDLLREYNKKQTDEARFESLREILIDELKNLKPIILNKYKPRTASKKVTGIVMFSDWHIGKFVKNQWNTYDNDIAIERVNNIVDKVIEKSALHGVTDLVVEINGDIIDGIIQVSSRNAAEADVISQIKFATKLLIKVINKLKPYYENIKIVTTLGNHGRIFADKKNGQTKENFEMLIPEGLELVFGDEIPIIKSDGLDFTSYEINGELVCVAHGQNDKLSTVIADFSKIYKRVPSAIHLGHTHSYQDINDCDIYVTANGSLCGSDDYSVVNCRSVTKAAQTFVICDDDRCCYNLLAN